MDGNCSRTLMYKASRLEMRALEAHQRELSGANVVVLDIADDPDGAVAVCEALRRQQPQLPILALLCCDQPTRPWHVRRLLELGVDSFLDARVEPVALGAELAALAGGGKALHLRLNQRRSLRIADVLSGRAGGDGSAGGALSREQADLVELVARGLTNERIVERLHLAPSTVHHRIAELCRLLNLPNRIALAGWAGAYGYFRPPEPN